MRLAVALAGISAAATADVLNEAAVLRTAGRLRGGGDNDVILENGVIRVGIDTTRGGSIGYLADAKNPDYNVINRHDMGREVQLSFYADPNFYNPPTADYPNGACQDLFMNQDWPWNPIGAGDIDGNRGDVLSVNKSADGKSIRIRTRPLQWACHKVACECEFEQHVELTGTGVKVTATLHNHRTDDYDESKPHSQELPAVYSIGELDRLVTYNGTAPWTGGALAEYATSGPPWVPGQFPATENWAALVNGDGWGMGVVNENLKSFLGGFAGKHGTGREYDSNTGYIAPVANVRLPKQGDYTFVFHLVLGDLGTIRSYAKQVMGA